MRKKTTVITGGAGFIGSFLCERLLCEGFKVICIDNLVTGNLKNIKQLSGDKHFDFIGHDISRPIRIKGSVNYVLHFASPASPEDYLRLPIQTLRAGSFGTYNALELAKEKKADFMLASTSEVYGDPLVHPQTEDYWGNVNPIGVRSCYDEAKRFGEAITMAYRRVHKLDTRIVRIFNTYGERMRINDGRVVPNFIYQALKNKDITVYGTGRQTRSFCYVSDLIEGIYRFILKKVDGPLNLGNPNEFTILELAELMLKLTGTKSKIIFKPLPKDDPKQRKPDISKANDLLKWLPMVRLEEGLIKTIDWFRINLI